MSTTLGPDLETIERSAAEHLDEEAGHVEADLDQVGTGPEVEDLEPERPVIRLAIAVAFPTLAAAIMVGGVFTGVGGRIYAAVSGLLGIALAVGAARLRRPALTYLAVIAGLFGIGLLMVVPSGIGNVASVGTLATKAAQSGDVLRPPVGLNAGWQAIIGWLMGITGFVAAWLAIVVGRAPVALLVPLPIAGIAGISVPKSAQIGSGIAVLVLFAIGLGILSTATAVGEDEERPPLGYEVRRAIRALPLLIAIMIGLFFLAKANVLFPRPYIDPAQEAQKPKTAPLSQVEDRVLFEVQSVATGPWRIGSLDVYDGKDWRLPPFAQNRVKDVPKSGIVDPDLAPGVRATFTVAGLTGAVLPTLPNTVGIVAKGPVLGYDPRNGNIRTSQGQVQAGLTYTAVAATLPSVDDLKALKGGIPKDIKEFQKVPSPPPAVVDLLRSAPKTSDWEKFDFLRSHVLDSVTATGTGQPKSVSPARVQEILADTQEASPFEIVAVQALLARWAGVPSRIGYGFDGGEDVGGTLQVRPRNGATFVEVFFPKYKWLPVIGVPKKAKPTVGSKPSQQQFDPTIVPSDDIGVELFLPVLTPAKSVFAKQVQRILLVVVPLALLVLLTYILYPGVRKALARSRRRTAAQELGPRFRVALAYTEWRDVATDLGYEYPTDTPLMFLERFIPDDEHTEFAWLVTRCLWGDLQDQLTPALASSAEELSRSLRRRLTQTQPSTVRVIAALSRLSLRHPYSPELHASLRKEHADEASAVA